ncbi:MAG: transporter, partial [Gammaproteobacteria bacterium]|nr:transporter [Gammaproteobacteria bacterium]
TTYDWESGQWNVPLVLLVSKVTAIGDQLIQVQAGPRYFASHFDGGPEGLGFRVAVTLLFPR